jgi:hypothetical protein
MYRPASATYGLPCVALGKTSACGTRPRNASPPDLVRRGRHHLVLETQHLARERRRVEDEEHHHLGPHLVEAVLEGRDDAEVPAATPEAPEEVGVLRLARREHAAVGGDHLDRHEVVDGEAMLAPHPAQTTPEREPGDARLGDDTQRSGQPVRLCLPVDVGQRAPGLRSHRARLGVDVDRLHPGQVDDETAVADRVARHPVASPAHGELETLLAGERHGGDDIRHAGTARDHSGELVHRAVPDASRLVVAVVTGLEHLALEPRA